MGKQRGIYTVESVTSGHPDKICDQISDAVLDECLRQDSKSRVAVETFGSHGLLVVGGEVTTNASLDYEQIGRKIYSQIGYSDNLKVLVNVIQQSPDIAQGVDTGGAGDQGIMYGYATSETESLMPKGVVLVHQLTYGLQKLREDKKVGWLKPDGKAQVTMEGDAVRSILVSCQHDEAIALDEIKQVLKSSLIGPLKIDDAVDLLVNPTGKFVVGGFTADTGLTGRKIMVDTYGGLIQHGGGAFSGKDPTKVDRSAAYMCRFVAKNLVANGYAKDCLVSVAYAIGKAEPLMIEAIDEAGKSFAKLVTKQFDFRPKAIIERLVLQRPIYQQTASYGHFGKAGLPWEEVIRM